MTNQHPTFLEIFLFLFFKFKWKKKNDYFTTCEFKIKSFLVFEKNSRTEIILKVENWEWKEFKSKYVTHPLFWKTEIEKNFKEYQDWNLNDG